MSKESARDELARDIFLADNANGPEEQMLKDWAITKQDRPIAVSYCYAIADGLIAKGYGKADHVEYAADHKHAGLEFADEDDELYADRAAFERDFEDFHNATLMQRRVGPWIPLEPSA